MQEQKVRVIIIRKKRSRADQTGRMIPTVHRSLRDKVPHVNSFIQIQAPLISDQPL